MKITTGNKLVGGFAATLTLIVSISLLSLYFSGKKVAVNNEIRKSNIILQEGAFIASLTKDIESGGRGYLITGDSSYLKYYTGAVDSVFQHTKLIKQLTADQPAQQIIIDSLEILLSKRIEFSQQYIVLRNQNRLADATALMMTRQGRSYSDRIRNVERRLRKSEMERRGGLESDIAGYDSAFNIAFGLFFLAVFTLLAVMFRGIRNEIIIRKRAEGSLEKLNAALEDTVKERTEKLLQSQLLYKSLFENMMHGFIYCQTLFDKEGNAEDYIYKAVNGRYSELTGLHDLLGKKVSDVVPGLRELDRPLFDTITRVSKSGQPEIFETFVQPLDRWYTVSMYCPHEGHFVALVDNVTDRKNAEIKLAASELKFRALLENSSDAIILQDNDLTVLYQSPATYRITGITMDLREANPRVRFTHPIDEPGVLEAVESSRQQPGNPIQFQSRLLHKGGHYIWIEGTITNLLHEPAVRAIVSNYRDITDRKKSEDQQALYFSIVNSSDDAIVSKTVDGSFTSWNTGAEMLFGYTEDEILGKNESALMPPDRPDEYKEIWERLKRGERVDHYETRRMRKDGSIVPISMTVSPLKDSSGNIVGSSKIARDISERLAQAEKLAASENRFRALIENSAEGLTLYGEKFDIFYQSPAAERMLGYELEERRLYPTSHFIHPDNMVEFQVLFGNVKANPGKPFPFQIQFKHKYGNYIWMEGVLNNLLNDPSVKAIVANFRDVTARKEVEAWKEKQTEALEEEVIKRTQELSVAKYAAEEANRTKGQFLANMSHEIRTPLNAVIGLSYLTLKTTLTDKQEDYVQKIHSSSESLLGIINDILDFSKIEAGKLTLEAIEFDLEDVLQKLADVISYKAHAKGLEIAFEIPANAHTRLIGDPVRLQQILNNLCSNAVKFTHEGEVVVVAKVIEDTSENVKFQFEIRDTGIGMTEEQLIKLFAPFTQADDTVSRMFGGTGLGLSIVKLLLEMMDGEVWVESKSGKGSTFFFTAWFGKQESQREIHKPSVDLQNLPVLVVDDNKSALKIMKRALEALTFQVTVAASGSEALQYLKDSRQNPPFRLILMDWQMPGMDGLRVAEVIRKDSKFKAMRIVMLCSGYANEEVFHRIEDLDLSGILIKPIRYSTLFDTVITAFGAKAKKARKANRDNWSDSNAQKKAHLLLAEDNEINQQVARELLEGFGYSVDIVNNGLEALNKLKADAENIQYDLVFMDLQMPVMGGYEATENIRKLKQLKSLPIVAMTADAMDGVKEKCLRVGMNDFITKPINPNQLTAMLEKWVKGEKVSKTRTEISRNKQSSNFPELKGIDTADGLSRLNGNEQLYRELLSRFHEEHQHFVVDLSDRLTRGDESVAYRQVHTLKGTSANLGMVELNKIVTEVENVLKVSTSDRSLDKILSPLRTKMEEILEALGRSITHEKSTSSISFAEASPILGDLKKLLIKQDLEAINLLKKIGSINGHEVQFDQVKKSILNFEFEKAIGLLESLEN